MKHQLYDPFSTLVDQILDSFCLQLLDINPQKIRHIPRNMIWESSIHLSNKRLGTDCTDGIIQFWEVHEKIKNMISDSKKLK